ncbi:unnamed protein product [Trichogramma brassicae]|uniref:CCHC-type domain-containing protein n=1 Tax=Trichogramma brassicae TaxID=86971 RepID=A0A6H5IF51_9HYME|nr:unnamed protein product [Trichogramma brassicae]
MPSEVNHVAFKRERFERCRALGRAGRDRRSAENIAECPASQQGCSQNAAESVRGDAGGCRRAPGRPSRQGAETRPHTDWLGQLPHLWSRGYPALLPLLDPGHVLARCKGPDRSAHCFRCGQTGHRIKDCKYNPTCVFCKEQGAVHDHASTSQYCPLAQKTNQAPWGKRPLIVAGDFNAWSTEWGCQVTRQRDTILLDALATLEAALLNTGDSLTFTGALGYSFIDLTFASDTLASRITSWALSELYTHSDHQAIVFEIETARPPRPTTRQSSKWLEPSRKSCPTPVGPEVADESSMLTPSIRSSFMERLEMRDGDAGLHPSSKGCTLTSLPTHERPACGPNGFLDMQIDFEEFNVALDNKKDTASPGMDDTVEMNIYILQCNSDKMYGNSKHRSRDAHHQTSSSNTST